MRVFTKLTVTELRLLLREPLAAFFSLLFPTLLVVILGSIPASGSRRRTWAAPA